MNRKSSHKPFLICLAIFLFPFIACFLYLFINSFISREKVYYIPQVEMYIKTIVASKDYAGYILFGKNSNLSISDTIDYITVSSTISNVILIDPSKKNNIYLRYDIIERIEDNKLVKKIELMYDKKNQVKYTMIDVAYTDTCLLEYKESYISIVFEKYFKSVEIRNVGDSIYRKLESIQ